MLRKDYWHVYYDAATIDRSDALRQEYCIEAADVVLHVDGYLRPDPAAPLILLTHGEGSYSRMFVTHALSLYDRGYSVLVLDQRGHGFSTGLSTDFTLMQLTQDVLYGAHWARRSFQGPLFLAGVNLGGMLAYQATALGAPVVGLACHNLYDFANLPDVLASSRYSGLVGMLGGVYLAGAAAKTLMAISPRMQLSLDAVSRLDGILDERDNGRYEAWREDPNLQRTVSLRYAVSKFTMPPALPFEENAMPVLVINPLRDRVVSPAVTRASYERLSGPRSYVEMDYGHWSMLEPFAREWSGVLDGWIQKILG